MPSAGCARVSGWRLKTGSPNSYTHDANSMKQYPYTVDNGRGEGLTFTGISHRPDGDRAGADGIAQPGAGPPMHVHYLQDEAARVVSGRMGYQVLGQETKFAEAGELVLWPAGTPHKSWNAGTTELRLSG